MYRVAVLSVVYSVSHHRLAQKAGKISVSISAAFINLTAILILNKVSDLIESYFTVKEVTMKCVKGYV